MTLPAVRRARTWLRRVRWALVSKPTGRTIRRVKLQKSAQEFAGHEYLDEPKTSVIVQSFNQARNVALLESRLRAAEPDELIVCEDGSIDGSFQAWAARLTGPNDFLLRSNDIHEIRTYGRAIAYARGEIMCLMQDDDQPPADGRWLGRAVDLFARYPKLAVLGGWCGFDDYFEVEYNAPWLAPGAGTIPFADPATGIPLVFVENVNIGPYLLRKSVFEKLGGFDLRFSLPGEPGITFEAEFCYRVWRHGHQVALTDIPVKAETGAGGYIFPGGTSLWGLQARERNEERNKRLIEATHGPYVSAIQRAIEEANRVLAPDGTVSTRD